MAGKIISMGDSVIRSDIARKLFDVNGSGIKVGIISTSFNALSGLEVDIKSGDLPGKDNPFGKTIPVTILKDITKNSFSADDEGRAIAQIIHDTAPGAEIFFHTIFEGEGQTVSEVNEESFAKAVSALSGKGVDIIIDDTPVPAPFFQDGVAVQAVQEATDKGITLISAAGNNGNISYESEFRPEGTFSFADISFEAHDFDAGENIDLFQDIEVTKDGTLIRPLLSWDEPIGNVNSEYKIFLLSSPELPNENNVISVSTIPSFSAIDTPLRTLISQPQKDDTLYFLIAREDTDSDQSNMIKWVSFANGADRTTTYEYIDNDSLNRTVLGQANAPTSIAVGATDVENSQDIRTYTSTGGSPILFDTEGNRLSTPILREKPEIFAPDGVETTFNSDTPFNPFRGTSASAPHVAGIVALMLERADRNLTPEDIRTKIQDTALSINEIPGLVQADGSVLEAFVTEEIGSEFTDFIHGTDSADNLYGNEGGDVLIGRGGHDYLVGGDGIDILFGGNGNDVLDGGKDNDILNGGKGADRFVFRSGDGQDKILDYRDGEDFFALEKLTFEDLTITQADYSTLIEVTNTQESLAQLFGTQADLIGVEDFIVLV